MNDNKELYDKWADCIIAKAEVEKQRDELLKACQSAYRAIVLGNGREIDWNEIADELRAAIAKAEDTK